MPGAYVHLHKISHTQSCSVHQAYTSHQSRATCTLKLTCPICTVVGHCVPHLGLCGPCTSLWGIVRRIESPGQDSLSYTECDWNQREHILFFNQQCLVLHKVTETLSKASCMKNGTLVQKTNPKKIQFPLYLPNMKNTLVLNNLHLKWCENPCAC